MLLRSSANMMPHSGVGGCAPSPRNESAAAEMIAPPMPSVPWTMRGVMALGKMRRNRMRAGDTPKARSAVTKSISLTEITLARAMRA